MEYFYDIKLPKLMGQQSTCLGYLMVRFFFILSLFEVSVITWLPRPRYREIRIGHPAGRANIYGQLN